MALAADRNTPRAEGDVRRFGVSAGAVIHAGALVVLSAGFAEPGSAALNLVAVGRAEEAIDNTGGADGDVTVDVRRGVFRFKNSAAADEITAAEIGATAYVVDDETVAKTDGTGARSAAGTIHDVDALGVWVEF